MITSALLGLSAIFVFIGAFGLSMMVMDDLRLWHDDGLAAIIPTGIASFFIAVFMAVFVTLIATGYMP